MIRDRLQSIYRLGLKELFSLARDTALVGLIVYAFTYAVFGPAKCSGRSHPRTRAIWEGPAARSRTARSPAASAAGPCGRACPAVRAPARRSR